MRLRGVYRAFCITGTAILSCAIAVPPAAAQGLEEVIVTAQKREESLQDVPAAISAFQAETIREQAFSSLLEVSSNTPGLQISNFSVAQPEIAIRGISTKEDGVGANDSTVVSVDDVYIAARSAQIVDLFDLERIEVLRGPQGTLYGRNSIGGSINLVTVKPNADFRVRVEQTFARFDRYDTRGLINGALAPEVFGKLSFSRRIADGYTDSLVDGVDDSHDQDSIYVRGQLLWEISEATEALFTVDYGHDDHGPTNREPVGSAGVNGANNSSNPIAVNKAFGGANDVFDSLSDAEGFLDRDVYGLSAKVTHDFEAPVTLTSITALRRSELDWLEDSSGLPTATSGAVGQPPTVGFRTKVTDAAVENVSQFTQEFRLSSRDFEALTWVTGVFLTYERMTRTETFDFLTLGATQQSLQKNDTFAWALYGQATYEVTDRLRFTAGGRYSHEKKTYRAAGEVERPTAGPLAVGLIVGNFTAVEEDDVWTSFDGRFALDFDVTDDIMVFGAVAEGFKSGGFTGAPATPAIATTPFDPEQATNYEIGVKSRLYEQRLQANVTAFWTDYDDLQVTTFTTLAPPNARPLNFGQFITENAGTAEVKGVEVELTALPLDDLELGASLAWLDARFTEFEPVFPRLSAAADFTGNRLRQSPEWTASVYGRYVWRSDSGATVVLRIDGRYQDALFYDPENDDFFASGARNQSQISDFQVWDARVAYTTPGGRIEVAAFLRNMFDEEYETHRFTQSGGSIAFGLFAPPRTYGATVTLTYE